MRVAWAVRVVVCFAALLLGPGATAASTTQAGERRLTILHTNDLHARLLPDARGHGGFAELAAMIRTQCATADACIVMDAGDLVQGTPVSTLFGGVPIFRIANFVGIDVSTLGNHEFDYGWQRIAEYREVANFPILNANVVGGHPTQLADAASTILKTENGIRVGVIGVLTETLPYLVSPEHLGDWKALPVKEAVEAALVGLRERCDLLVVLGHITEREERELLGVAGVDLVVSGHAHAGLKLPLSDDDTAVFRVKGYGQQLGRIDLVLSKRPLAWTWQALPVTGVEPEPATLKEVLAWEARVSKRVDKPLAHAARDYDRAELRTLFERAMREETGADLAYLNPGAIRDRFVQGELLERDVWNAMPFDEGVLVGTVTGADLPASVRRERGLDENATYRLATIPFVAAQWRRHDDVELKLTKREPLRDLLIRWIRKQRRLP